MHVKPTLGKPIFPSSEKGAEMKNYFFTTSAVRMLCVISFCLSLLFQACSKEDSDTTPPPQDNIVKDIDGNIYHSIEIGTQVWMSENLKTTKYKDGTSIPFVSDDSQWAGLSTSAYCWYGNQLVNASSDYGALYNYYAVATDMLCPEGWHVPSSSEWNILYDFVGADGAGGKLKQTGTSNWLSPNTGATDEFAFSALPGGTRIANNGLFKYFNTEGNWWTSSGSSNNGSLRWISFDSDDLLSSTSSKRNGYSVRCLKD